MLKFAFMVRFYAPHRRRGSPSAKTMRIDRPLTQRLAANGVDSSDVNNDQNASLWPVRGVTEVRETNKIQDEAWGFWPRRSRRLSVEDILSGFNVSAECNSATTTTTRLKQASDVVFNRKSHLSRMI